MVLPGRLRSTTLGDVLGTLHRARASGTLEIAEDRGRVHRVHLTDGLVTMVEVDGATPSLAEVLRRDRLLDDDVLRRSLLRAMASRRLHGEVLVGDFGAPETAVEAALRRQLAGRLAALERLGDAQLRFRVAVRSPRGALPRPLAADEFLRGRRRMRDGASAHGSRAEAHAGRAEAHADRDRAAPLRVLGLDPTTRRDPEAIKRAYRALARRYHPDLHPSATDDERRALATRFAEVTAAYRALCA